MSKCLVQTMQQLQLMYVFAFYGIVLVPIHLVLFFLVHFLFVLVLLSLIWPSSFLPNTHLPSLISSWAELPTYHYHFVILFVLQIVCYKLIYGELVIYKLVNNSRNALNFLMHKIA